MLTIGDGFVCHEVTVLLIIVIGILFIFSYYYASGLDPFSSLKPLLWSHLLGKKNHEIMENR